MSQKRGLIGTLQDSGRGTIINSWVGLGFTTVLGFWQLWLGALAVQILPPHNVEWMDFVRHGEFAMYSAALLATCLRFITRDTDSGNFVHRQWFGLLAFLGLAFSVALYCFVKAATQLGVTDKISEVVVAYTSVPMLGATLFFAFVVFLLDNQRSNPPVDAIARRQVQVIMNDLKPNAGE